jgi:hypothetical protein
MDWQTAILESTEQEMRMSDTEAVSSYRGKGTCARPVPGAFGIHCVGSVVPNLEPTRNIMANSGAANQPKEAKIAYI